MSQSTNKINKFWIYLPIYLLIWASSVIWLYRYLNQTPKEATIIENPEINPPVEQKNWAACFDQNKADIEGILSITPNSALASTVDQLSKSCVKEICADMKAVNSGDLDILDFYTKSKSDRDCLAKVLDEATEYHKEQLQTYDVLPLFYNAGQSQLNSKQKSNLSFFLKIFKKKATASGLLIIGRASATGTRAKNKRLSKARAEEIVDYIATQGMTELKNNFVYFGADPPQLTLEDAEELSFTRADYRNIRYGSGRDDDYAIRLNQSVLLIIYDKAQNPFGLDD